jgi:hypothetical protein
MYDTVIVAAGLVVLVAAALTFRALRARAVRRLRAALDAYVERQV